jgi:hypothetical protein
VVRSSSSSVSFSGGVTCIFFMSSSSKPLETLGIIPLSYKIRNESDQYQVSCDFLSSVSFVGSRGTWTGR